MYPLNEEQQALIARIRVIGDEIIGPQAAASDSEGHFPRASLDALASAGFLGLTVAREYGGMGEGIPTACAALDAIAQRCASTAMVYLMHLCGCAAYALRPAVAAASLRKAAQGHHLATLAWSEKGSRSHFWSPVSQAQSRGENLLLNAEKSWVTAAGEADGYVVSTRSPGGTEPTDTLLCLVLKGDPGVAVSGPWNSLGMRGNDSAPMRLTECVIPGDRALCDAGGGFPAMMQILPWFNLGNAAVSVGISEAATASAIGHITSSRLEHLNSSLADLPNLRARLARMRIETDAARAHLVSALHAVQNPSDATMLMVLESKTMAGETAIRVTDTGMRACGGAAFSKHLTVERNFRDARAASVMAPTSDVLHDFIGRALCGMPLF
ncbi:MAG: acyl-CoA/acyl-ACP dehydrogenase [Chloroflexi bacterium]|nr:acyl-CoA/acyl-ACP dehydrogenase [Chloroflexota bacterium]